MQDRRGAGNSGAINENTHKSNRRKCRSNVYSDSSDGYSEETHISYQFRRWANNIWSVSNNVTNRLRDLLGNSPSSNTTSNHSVEGSCPDESNATCSRTTSSGIIESSNQINDEDCKIRSRYHQHRENHGKNGWRENYCRYGQNFSHVTEGHRMHHVATNRAEIRPNFIMGHGLTTYPPVLILPRLRQRVNQQPMHTGFYHSRCHMLRRDNMHGDEYADGLYQHYHRSGKQWDCEGFRRRNNRSPLSERHQIPEKLSSLISDPKIEGFRKKPTRKSYRERKVKPGDCDFKTVKHFSTHIRDFCSESYGNGHESVPPIYDTRRSREKTFVKSRRSKNYRDNDSSLNCNQNLTSSARADAKEGICDAQLSDVTSQGPSFTNLSGAVLFDKSSVTLNIEKKKKTRKVADVKSTLERYENVEIPVKDDAKQQEITAPPAHDINAVRAPIISQETQQPPRCTGVGEKINYGTLNDDLKTGNGMKWSSVTENSVDSLLQSLRERMDTLANVHSLDTAATSGSKEFKRKEEANLTKECIVASCLAGTYLPSCLESKLNKAAGHSVTKNDEVRPSFSDRIQDIWRDGRSRVWRSSPRPETSSRYNLKSEKDMSSKLSFLGLNQQHVLREYFGEYNNAVTLARILEKLIDSKAKSDAPPTVVSEGQKPLRRISREQSKTCVRVNVGVQKSTKKLTTSQDQASYSRNRLIQKQSCRKSLRRTFKPRISELPIETPRPLQVVCGQSIVPISSIQLAPVYQPLSDISGFSPPLVDAGSFFNYGSHPSGKHGHSTAKGNPVIQETSPAAVVDTGLKYSPTVRSKYKDSRPSLFASNHGSPSSTKESSFSVKDKGLVSHEMEYSSEEEIKRQIVNEREQILSFVLEKIDHEREREQRIFTQDTNVSQQYAQYHSTSVGLQQSESVANDKSEISAKGQSWWSKKLQFSKSSSLKDKLISLLKYVTEKHARKDCQPKKYTLEKAVGEILVPIPPIRVRRKSVYGGTKCTKSIQWESDVNLLRSAPKIDSFQVPEIQQLSKSTSVSPIIGKVTVASGTNTNLKKSPKKNSKLSPVGNKVSLVRPKIVKATKRARTDTSSKLTASVRTPIESDIIADAKEQSESASTDNTLSFNGPLFSGEKNFESTNDTRQREEINLSKLKRFKVSRSLSSKIPLATRLVTSSNVLSAVSGKRPNTAPILDRSPSNFSGTSQGNVFLGEFEARRSFSRETASQEGEKKMLFKHNRSSLLRANNSVSKKSAMGQSNLTRKMTGDKDVEKKSISKASTSPETIDEKEGLSKLFSGKETGCRAFVSAKELEEIDGDSKTKSLLLADAEMSSSSEFPSIFSTSVRRTNQTFAGKIPFYDIIGVPLLKTTDLMHKKKDISRPILPSRLQLIDQKDLVDKDARSLPGENKRICTNFEHLKGEQRSSESRTTFSLDNPTLFSHNSTENETPIENLESQKLGNKADTICGSTLLIEEKSPCEISLMFPQKDEKLSTQLEVNENSNSESVDFKTSKESDTESSCTKNSIVQEQQDSSFVARRVEVDKIQPCTMNEKTQLQPVLADSIARKTDKYLLKPSDTPVQKLISRNKDIPTPEKSWRTRLHCKSIPNSGLSQVGIKKSGIKSSRLLCKRIMPSSVNVSRFNSASNELNTSLSKVCGIVEHSQNPIVEKLESKECDSLPVCKTVKPESRVGKSTKNRKLKSVKLCKTENKNTEEILEMVRKMLDVAISNSVNIDRKMNLEPVSSAENIHQRIISNSENLSQLSIDSLELIRVQSNPQTPLLIEKNICSAVMNEGDEKCTRIFKQEIISDAITNNRHNDCQGIRLSKKFIMAIKPLAKNKASEISEQLSTKGDTDARDECNFAIPKSQMACRSSVISYWDNEVEVITMPPKMVSDRNRKQITTGRSFEIEHYLEQSIITFDLAEFADKPEKLRPSMFNIHLEGSVELDKSKRQGSYNKKKLKNERLSDTDINSSVTEDENDGKIRKGGRNVKIDNKVLEEKVKCSIENGVPLKTITIMDPSVIKHNYLNHKSSIADKNTCDERLSKMRSEVNDKLAKNLCNNSQSTLSDDKSGESCSHTMWTSHENQNINIEGETVLEIHSQSKSGNVGPHSAEEIAHIIDKVASIVEQDNLIPNMTNSHLKEKATRPRGTLIPRYKKLTLDSPAEIVVLANPKNTKGPGSSKGIVSDTDKHEKENVLHADHY